MAQTYQMKHNPQGTIYSLLTVESDGQMTMTFHGTDREISHEANVTEDGRIVAGGSLFPGLESGKWQAVAMQMRNEKGEMRNEVQGTVPREPRPRRQRKQRVERQEPITVNHDCNATLSEREPLTVNHQPSATMKAVGMVAAATVALLVIYETGLLIPLGLIGLATGGILK